jgi:hypothetical protein
LRERGCNRGFVVPGVDMKGGGRAESMVVDAQSTVAYVTPWPKSMTGAPIIPCDDRQSRPLSVLTTTTRHGNKTHWEYEL